MQEKRARGEPQLCRDFYDDLFVVVDDYGEPVGPYHFTLTAARTYREDRARREDQGILKYRIAKLMYRALPNEEGPDEIVDDPRAENATTYLNALVHAGLSEGRDPLDHVYRVLNAKRAGDDVEEDEDYYRGQNAAMDGEDLLVGEKKSAAYLRGYLDVCENSVVASCEYLNFSEALKGLAAHNAAEARERKDRVANLFREQLPTF